MPNSAYPAILVGAAIIAIVAGMFYVTASAVQPPTWSEQSQSADSADPGETVVLSALLTDDAGLKTATLNSGARLKDDTDGIKWTTDTQELEGREARVTFRYVVPSYPPGTRIRWHIEFFDIDDNRAVTGTKEIVVTDSAPPQILEQKQEADNVVFGRPLLLSARVSDNYRVTSVSFETNETGAFKEVRRYNLSLQNAVTSMSWSNPDITNETYVGWRVVVKDSWGNGKTSDTLVFKVRGCPSCPPRSAWSDCEADGGKGKQSQIFYDCGEYTNYTCILQTVTRICTPGVTRDGAKEAMDSANTAVLLAKSENKDVQAAEKLFVEAQAAYDKGDWDLAKAKATDARLTAETAVVSTPPGTNYLPYVALAVIILVGAWVLLRFGKIRLPIRGKPGQAPTTAIEAPVQPQGLETCSTCGRQFPELYTCEECGAKVCYDDARTYEGKVYCVNDLRKRGLL